MKISELLNEATSNRTDTFEIKLSFETHFAPKVIAIRDALIKANLTGVKVKLVDKPSSSNQVRITLNGKLPFNKTNIEHQLERVREVVESFNKIDKSPYNEGSSFPIVFIDNMPNSPIEWPVIYLNSNSNTALSLAGVDKLIKADELFRIEYANMISDSVVGLLKIKGKLILNNADWGNKFKTVEWVKIITSYRKSENQDIVACQREMIEQDLDEYAEF
jgi:hypothetical protein